MSLVVQFFANIVPGLREERELEAALNILSE